jgi:hypothetical protein
MLTGALAGFYFALVGIFGIGTPIGLVARHCKEKKRKTQDAYDQKMAAIAARADSENTHLAHGNLLVGLYGDHPPAPDFAPPAGKECTDCGCWTPTNHNLCALCIDMDSDIEPEPEWDIHPGSVVPVQYGSYAWDVKDSDRVRCCYTCRVRFVSGDIVVDAGYTYCRKCWLQQHRPGPLIASTRCGRRAYMIADSLCALFILLPAGIEVARQLLAQV